MVNETKENFRYETFLFDCQLEILLNNNEIIPFNYEYSYENNLKSYQSDLRCLNCHANLKNQKINITQKAMPNINSPKLLPKSSLEGVNLDFEVLSRGKWFKELEKLHNLMIEHYDSCKKSKLANNSEYEKSF